MLFLGTNGIQTGISKVALSNLSYVWHLVSKLCVGIDTLHHGERVDSLSLHQLNFITECGVSIIFLHHDHIDHLLEIWVLEDCLRLAGDTEWETNVGHHCTGVVRCEHEIRCFDFALRLVWASITVINATCELEHWTHFWVECPLTSKLELLTHWQHHIDVNSIDSFVLFEHLGAVLNLFESFWFPKWSKGD